MTTEELIRLAEKIADFAQEMNTAAMHGGGPFQHFTCGEVDSLAGLLVASGNWEVAAKVLADHARSDDPDDSHTGLVGEVPNWELIDAYIEGHLD